MKSALPHANLTIFSTCLFCRNRKAVVLGNTFADLDLPCVLTDDRAGMRMVMDYLFELGHRRIAFAGNTLDSLLVVNRLEAYRRGLDQGRVPSDQRLVKLHAAWSLSPEQMTDFCRRSLDELLTLEAPPTAIVCTTDSFALEFIQAARMRRLRIPENLSITGYGDMDYAAFMDPSLTTVRVDQRATGEAAAMQLLQQIEGATHASQTLIRPTFVERRSCAALKTVNSKP